MWPLDLRLRPPALLVVLLLTVIGVSSASLFSARNLFDLGLLPDDTGNSERHEDGSEEKFHLAVVTKKPVVPLDIPASLLRQESRAGEGDEDGMEEGGAKSEMVEYNIAAFGKDYKLQFSKNKRLLPPGFRIDWKR